MKPEEKIHLGIVIFAVVFIISGIVFNGYCKVRYWNTPWIDVPFICHL